MPFTRAEWHRNTLIDAFVTICFLPRKRLCIYVKEFYAVFIVFLVTMTYICIVSVSDALMPGGNPANATGPAHQRFADPGETKMTNFRTPLANGNYLTVGVSQAHGGAGGWGQRYYIRLVEISSGDFYRVNGKNVVRVLNERECINWWNGRDKIPGIVKELHDEIGKIVAHDKSASTIN